MAYKNLIWLEFQLLVHSSIFPHTHVCVFFHLFLFLFLFFMGEW